MLANAQKTLLFLAVIATAVVGIFSASNTALATGSHGECILVIEKWVSKDYVTPGDIVDYKIVFKNIGDKNCTGTGVHVLDYVDPRLTYLSEIHSTNVTAGYWGPTYDSSDRSIHWNADTLSPGEEGWVIWSAKVGTPKTCSELIPNTAHITSKEYQNFTTWIYSNTVNIEVEKDCTPPPPTCTLVANPKTIASGGTSKLTWTTTNATSASINQGVGAVTPVSGGHVSVSPTADTTYKLTATGAGGTVSCTDTVKVTPPPPQKGCIAILKETYDTNGNPLTPVAQFTFKLDGSATTQNDANGNAMFTNVTPGLHTVTEVLPPTWEMLSVTPSNGQVLVSAGPTCAGVVFKNKQVLPPPPPGECKLKIEKSVSKTAVGLNDQFEYTITFKNIGTKNCTGGGVKVVDVIDDRTTYVSESHSSNVDGGYGSDPVYKSSDHTLRWNADTLTPGEEGWVKWKGKVKTLNSCSETVPNKAKITAKEYNNFKDWEESNTVNVTVSKDCTPPPQKGCIAILKETFNTNGDKITPVAQFTFKLDGDKTTQNDADGNAMFTNVTPGLHTVTEILPATWTQLSVTPVNGEVLVQPGPVCAAVVFKNKQVITTTPPPVCSLVHTSGTQDNKYLLGWVTSNATSFVIDQSVGSVTPVSNGSKEVTVTTTTKFTGTATGPGGTVTCDTTITVTPPPGPVCTLSVSASQIKTGESVKVSWTSSNATSGTITSVGNATPVSSGISGELFPSSDTTYTGTFTGPHGTVTCTASVVVKPGTTGCQGNCGGGGFNQPNVVLYKKATDEPLVASVFLSQIPYTGFEAGPALTAIFWLTVALLAAAITYFAMERRGTQFLSNYLAAFAGVSIRTNDKYVQQTREEEHAAPVQSEASYSQSVVVSSSSRPTVAPTPIQTPSAPATEGIPPLNDVIESRAHAAGVLMSPEAVSAALGLSTSRAETLRIFGEVLNEAVRTIPREDGWIMLTSDRLNELVQKRVGGTQNTLGVNPVGSTFSASTISSETHTSSGTRSHSVSEGTNVDEASAVAFVGAIVSGDRETAFGIVRSLEHASVNPRTLMTATATVLDRLYRVRHGGKNGVDQELLNKASSVTDDTLHALVEVFTHALDTVYSNPFTGIKLALAQAFDIVG